jgi:predicted RNase H-like HicB family nuclease
LGLYLLDIQNRYSYSSRYRSSVLKRGLTKQYNIVVEKHPDGYVAYLLVIKGVVVGPGETSEEVLSEVKSASRFHIESFGNEDIDIDTPVIEAFAAEAGA